LTPLRTLVVWVADGCSHCEALVADFRMRGVVFEVVNLSAEPERLAELREHSWEHRLPVVVDHEKVSIGFRGRSSSYAEVGLE